MKKNTIFKGCLGGCAGLVLLGMLGLIAGHYTLKNLTPAQRAALKAQTDADYTARHAGEEVPVESFLNKFRDLRARIPAPTGLQEQRVPAFPGDSVEYLAVDAAFLDQFTGLGFVPETATAPAVWYRGQPIQNIQGALVISPDHPHRDNTILLSEQKEIAHAPYLAVFVPQEQRWPVLNADGKTFQAGSFRGWVVLVDGKDWKILGQTPFNSGNSEKVTSLRVGLGHELVGADLKQALEDDFTDRFWKSADDAVARLCGRDGKASFASRRDSFPSGD